MRYRAAGDTLHLDGQTRTNARERYPSSPPWLQSPKLPRRHGVVKELGDTLTPNTLMSRRSPLPKFFKLRIMSRDE